MIFSGDIAAEACFYLTVFSLRGERYDYVEGDSKLTDPIEL